MSILCYGLKQIPDLTLNKYQSLADAGIEGVLKRHNSFLRQWHGICIESNTSIHLLYTYLPSEPIGEQLKVFFLIQGDADALQLVKPLLTRSPLSDFFTLTEGVLPQLSLVSASTMTKSERIADIFNPMAGKRKSVHYVPKWAMNEDARQYDLLRIMETVCQAYTPESPCAFRIDLYPVDMTQQTRMTFHPVLKSLRGGNDIQLIPDTESLKSDSYSQNICKQYEDWLASIETSPHFRVNIYSFANTVFQTKVLLNAAGSEAVREGDFSIAQLKTDADGAFTLLSRMEKQAYDYCFYPNQAALKSWPTTYCLSEIAPFFRFPTLYDGEILSIPKETAPIQATEGLYLGKDTNGYPVYFPIKDLTRHAFFSGMPGSGKTNTMLHLISQIKKYHIPFLALEPAKKEYRALLGSEEMKDVFLFSPHLQSRFPLRMNPMAFPVGVRLSEHINALLEVFQGSFVLEGPTYKFLSSAIQRSYADLGWDIEDVHTEECELDFPTLQDVYNNLQQEIDASSYDAELKGNVRAFLQVRLGGLMERDAGELFNVPYSTLSPGEWIRKSAIIELEVLGEQAKNFFILLVCHYILETLRADPLGGVDKEGNMLPIRHVVFIEEAHNILAPSTHQSSTDSIDPKISATAYIVKMLAEVRAMREAIVIADQLPTALANEVTKNTGLKLVHRLTSQDDRGQIGSAISASSLQLERMASFTSGQAFIYHEKTMRPFEMQVAQWGAPDASLEYSNDEQLYARVCSLPSTERSIVAALNCWKEMFLFPVDDQIIGLEKRYLSALETRGIKAIDQFAKETENLLVACERLKRKLERMKKLWMVQNDERRDLCNDFGRIEDYLKTMRDRILQIIDWEGRL